MRKVAATYNELWKLGEPQLRRRVQELGVARSKHEGLDKLALIELLWGCTRRNHRRLLEKSDQLSPEVSYVAALA